MKLLIDAVQSSRFIIKQKSKELIKKLSAFVAPNQASVLKRHLYFDSRVKTNNEAIYITSDNIQTAIVEKKKIGFQYFDYDVNGKQKLRHHGEQYLVSPFDLIWSNDTYYLVGFHDKKEIVAKFRVDRIKNLIVTGIRAVSKPKDYSVAEFFLQEFSMLHGDKRIVTLLCQNDLINSIIDRFGVDVKTTVVDDNHFTITVPVNLSNFFYGWVFSSAGKMKIIEPQQAIDGFQKIIEQYL